MTTSTKRKCEFCNEPLKRTQKRFCSNACRGKNQTQEALVITKCKQCGGEFEHFRHKNRQFCSHACVARYQSEKRSKTVICQNCGEPFRIRKSKDQKFCSRKCSIEWHTGPNHPNWIGPVDVFCDYCGTEFAVNSYTENTQEHFFCSTECYSKWCSETRTGSNNPNWRGGPVVLQCDQCNQDFEIARSALTIQLERGQIHFFCSRDCMAEHRSIHYQGKDSPTWQGGISLEPYGDGFDDNLRRSIRERDGFECQLCGRSQKENRQLYNRRLPVHHIDYDKENHSSENLITLCSVCHPKTNINRDHFQQLFTEMLEYP